jgi:hypothetical protein
MEDREFSSGTFILPPKADHEGVLEELRAVVEHRSTRVSGHPMSDFEANMVLTLYHGLDNSMRDQLMSRSVEDMLATTIRCRSLSAADSSWHMFENKRVG